LLCLADVGGDKVCIERASASTRDRSPESLALLMLAPPIRPGIDVFVPASAGDLQFQKRLNDSQWWSTEQLREHQEKMLRPLVSHATQGSPLNRERLEIAGIDPRLPTLLDQWSGLSPLTRRQVRQQGAGLRSLKVPRTHGALLPNTSSGSTGEPVTVMGTLFDAWIAKALNLRHYLWHGYDFTGHFAAIRHLGKLKAVFPYGASFDHWGDTATFPFSTGPASGLSIRASVVQQGQWLQATDPDYLLTYPSNLLGLAQHFAREGIHLPHLDCVTTIGEVLTPEARATIENVLDTRIADLYSAEEVGPIASQCPECDHYHVNAETCLVEVVDERGQQCQPGQIGRVLVTPFFNYATPLLRYEIGDFAEVGPPCPCGRGLQVLRRILGRERNALLLTAEGERYWPSFGSREFTANPVIVQHQFVQKDLRTLEARLVLARTLTQAEEQHLCATVLSRLPAPFKVVITRVAELPRNAGGKFENFVSELGVAAAP
jgi:phenylacetate-CoA ligase